MPLDHTRAVDEIVAEFDSEFGFPEDFDDTRMRQSLGIIVNAIYNEMKANMVVTVNLTSSNVTVDVDGEDYDGAVDNDESVGSVT